MVMGKDLKTFGVLMLALFLIGVITAVSFIGFGELKNTACTQADSTHVYSDGTCQESSTNTTEVTVTAITKLGIVESGLDTVLGLLGLFVIVAIFALVIKAAKGFSMSE